MRLCRRTLPLSTEIRSALHARSVSAQEQIVRSADPERFSETPNDQDAQKADTAKLRSSGDLRSEPGPYQTFALGKADGHC